MRVYLAPTVLIVERMGYLPLDASRRRSSSNWSARVANAEAVSSPKVRGLELDFGDTIIAIATLERLLHHSTTINIRRESDRLKDRRRAGLFPRPDEQQPIDRPRPSTAARIGNGDGPLVIFQAQLPGFGGCCGPTVCLSLRQMGP